MAARKQHNERGENQAEQAGQNGQAVADPVALRARVEVALRRVARCADVADELEVLAPEPDARLDVAVLAELVPADDADGIGRRLERRVELVLERVAAEPRHDGVTTEE